jgi:UDP-N-acetylmuramoyl-L-alanyl-D-glutamate--2,6-diaminopimelate ligase
MTLAQKIAGEADKAGKRFNENLFIILDRGDAIKKAIEIAKEGDVVLLTTRGSLNTMSIKGKKVSSDDRVIAREVLRNLLNKNN